MLMIGCDYHPSVQQIAMMDTETGECKERRLTHRAGSHFNQPEINRFPNRVVLAGTLTRFCSRLSASERSLYTELTVHVDEVYEDQRGSLLLKRRTAQRLDTHAYCLHI